MTPPLWQQGRSLDPPQVCLDTQVHCLSDLTCQANGCSGQWTPPQSVTVTRQMIALSLQSAYYLQQKPFECGYMQDLLSFWSSGSKCTVGEGISLPRGMDCA